MAMAVLGKGWPAFRATARRGGWLRPRPTGEGREGSQSKPRVSQSYLTNARWMLDWMLDDGCWMMDAG